LQWISWHQNLQILTIHQMRFWPLWHFFANFCLKHKKKKRQEKKTLMQRHGCYCKNTESCTKINIKQDGKRN
jgi:hypothetical protein